MEAVFQAPKRRTRVFESYGGPFPVPRTEEEESRAEEHVYRAELVHQHVLVRDPKHIQDLYGRGYFGKGILSRARPEHSISRLWEEYGDRHLPVISHSKYEQQLCWARGALLGQGLDEEAVNQTLLRLSQPTELEDHRKGAGGGENGHKEEKGEKGEGEENNVRVSSKGESDRGCTQRKRLQGGSDSEPEAPTQPHPEEGGLSRGCTQRKRLQAGSDSEPEAPPQLHPEEGGERRETQKAKRPRRQGDLRYDPLAGWYPEEPEQVDQKAKCPRHDDWIAHCGCRWHPDPKPDPQDPKHDPEPDPKDPKPDPQDPKHDPKDPKHDPKPDPKDPKHDPKDPKHDPKDPKHDPKHDPKDPKHDPKDPKHDPNPHPDSELLEAGYQYVLVAEDGPDDGQVERGGQRELRLNPFRLFEYLQLSLEEAFFLVYALGCLSVYYNEEPLTISQLWAAFRSVQPNFVCSYTAYHHYRSKGWVPKPGIKYGSDFMLYRKGPPFYHASYSVVVEQVGEAFKGATLRPFTWRSLAALSRITGNVSKELMLCYIIYPADLSDTELSSPLCLSRLTVQEVLLSRWISSERAEQDDI